LVSLIEAHNNDEDTLDIVTNAVDSLKLKDIDNIVLIGLTAMLFHKEMHSMRNEIDPKYLYDIEDLLLTKEYLKVPVLLTDLVEDEEIRSHFSMFYVARILKALMFKFEIHTFSFNDDGINYGFARSIK